MDRLNHNTVPGGISRHEVCMQSYDYMANRLNAVTAEVSMEYPGYIIDYDVDINTLQWRVAVTYPMQERKDYRRCIWIYNQYEPVTIDAVVRVVEMVKEVVDGQSAGD